MDLRESWISDLLASLSHGFVKIQEKLRDLDYYDVGFAKEQAETIFGLAFVAAQTYITGTISDMFEINSDCGLSKQDMLFHDSPQLNQNVSKIILVNAIANYFKHYEEWNGWEIQRYNRQTIQTLNLVGINENTTYPCHVAAQMIWPNEVLCELSYLLDVLVDWRKHLLERVKSSSQVY